VIITVSEYARSPLPGVLTDRKLGIELAQRFGVPSQNIVEVSEQQVTRDGLKQAFATVNEAMLPGDKLFVYFSGHGARFYNKTSGQCVESIVMQDMHVVTNSEFTQMLKPLSSKADKTIVMLDSCHSGGIAQMAGSRAISAGGSAREIQSRGVQPTMLGGGERGQLFAEPRHRTEHHRSECGVSRGREKKRGRLGHLQRRRADLQLRTVPQRRRRG
jgi:hypothetical protein